MRKTFGTLMIGFIFLSSNTVFGVTAGDGNELLSRCNVVINYQDKKIQNPDEIDIGICLGMIQGMMKINSVYKQKLGKEMALFCPPASGLSYVQAIRIVVKYLNDHPEKLHQSDTYLVIGAFQKAFPCM